MGIPSIAIYSYELYNFYGVENIIRIGSCGGYLPEMKLFDIILAEAAYSASSFADTAFGYKEDLMYPDKGITELLEGAGVTDPRTLAAKITDAAWERSGGADDMTAVCITLAE